MVVVAVYSNPAAAPCGLLRKSVAQNTVCFAQRDLSCIITTLKKLQLGNSFVAVRDCC